MKTAKPSRKSAISKGDSRSLDIIRMCQWQEAEQNLGYKFQPAAQRETANVHYL